MTTPSRPAPVLLCGYPKSGTTLLVSLLDGHPDLLVFPEELNVFRTTSRLPREAWLDALFTRTGVAHLRHERAETPSGPRDYAHVDFARLREDTAAAWARSDGSAAALVECLVAAYGAQLGRAPGAAWVEKTPRNELHLAVAEQWWPGVRAIQIVRDPRATFCSYRRKRERGDTPLHLDRFLSDWDAGVAAFDAFAARAPGRAHRVRYEDLVGDPGAVTEELARFLGIAWDAALLAPTRGGSAWTGNSMYGERTAGVSSAPASRPLDDLHPDEAHVLAARLGPRMQALGYAVDVPPDVPRIAAARVAWRSGRGIRGAFAMYRRLVRA